MKNEWFTVNKEGLRKLIEQYGKGRLGAELVQNSLDESVTYVKMDLTLEQGRPKAILRVEDDAPDGFRNLDHAFTFFAESYKKNDPEKRGRFNLGEKLVLSMCESASISTTTGTVEFHENGERHIHRKKREKGSVFEGLIKLTRPEFEEFSKFIKTLLIPESIKFTFNNELIVSRKFINQFKTSLETEESDENGVLRSRIRQTIVTLYEPKDGEIAYLYEMGIPIVELIDTGERWHIDIGQKIPKLNLNRNNTSPVYLKKLRKIILEEMCDKLTEKDVNATWVQQATSQPNVKKEAFNKFMDLRFGEKRASFDLSDPEANKAFQSMGGTVISGRTLSAEQWENARNTESVKPAGEICPTAKPYSTDPNAKEAEILKCEEYTEGMCNIIEYAKFLAQELFCAAITVNVVKAGKNFVACYGEKHLDFNLRVLGKKWFDQGATEEVDKLLLHEYGHQFCGDHLDHKYHKALCELGAKLKELALVKPEELKKFERGN